LSIENHDWKSLGLSVPVTISFGVAHSRGEVAPHDLIKEADINLYRAKNRGRNLVVV
jgi:PleD family two-component response regulator